MKVLTVASPALTRNGVLRTGAILGPSFVIGPGRMGETEIVPSIPLVVEGWGVPRTVGGHEYAGYVASVGDEVIGVDIGAPVTAVPTRVCGRAAISSRLKVSTTRSTIS